MKRTCIGFIAILVLTLAGCVSTPKKSTDSAIDVGRQAIIETVPIGASAAVALMRNDPKEHGTYRTASNRFCEIQTGANNAFRHILKSFTELCAAKGGAFNGEFCVKSKNSDDVLFMTKVQSLARGVFDSPGGRNDCKNLLIAEPIGTPDTADYQRYLVEQGYKNLAMQEQERQIAVARARERADADRKRRESELARLAIELPQMKKIGTTVCKNDGDTILRGNVDAYSDEKLKVVITQRSGTNSQILTNAIIWDNYISWRLC